MIINFQITQIILVSFSLILIFVIWIIWSDIIGAGFEPTSRKYVRRMLEMAQVTNNDLVYDLGSGDGRIVMEAARKCDARAVGIEADPIRYIWSKIKVLLWGMQKKVTITWGNFFREDLSRATVVTLFLSQKANQKLKQKLQCELKPGTRVVTYYWSFNGWEPVQTDKEKRIYMYIIGQTSSVNLT